MWIDSFIAIVFGLFIIYTAYTVLRETITGLMDEADAKTIDLLTNQLIENKKIAGSIFTSLRISNLVTCLMLICI